MSDRVPAPKLCTICGAAFSAPQLRAAHVSRAHPGLRMAWGGRGKREPTIVSADGSVRIVAPADYQKMRRAGIAAAKRGALDLDTPPPDAETASDGDAAPVEPGTGSPAPQRARPFVAQPPLVIPGETRAASVRESVASALTLEVFSDIIVSLSRALSDADGAGEAGVLSPIQARQVAMLAYDSTLDLIVVRFRGDVNRFKLGLAAVIIVASKGMVHARAIAGKVSEARAGGVFPGVPFVPVEYDAAVAGSGPTEAATPEDDEPMPTPSPVELDPIAALAQRQRADALERGRFPS